MRDDFIFDGRYASDYGLIICNFDSSSDENGIVSDINFDTFVSGDSDKNYFVASSTSNVLSTKIQVGMIKDCSLISMTDYDIEQIAKWLCREDGYHRFAFINNNDNNIEYNAKFSMNKIPLNDYIYGLELTITTDSQYGFSRIKSSYSLNQNEDVLLKNYSAKSGGIYPNLQITCKKSGDYIISFRFEQHTDSIEIKNCSIDEVINISDMHVISSSFSEHQICNDFNYVFPMIRSTFYNNDNFIQSNLLCDLTIDYETRRKAGI